jgi:hypothetical protein
MTFNTILTKKGKDVFVDTDIVDRILDFNLNTFKILAKGKLTSQTVNSNPKTFSLAHNFPFVPTFYAYCQFPDGTVALPGPFSINYRGTGTSPGTNYGSLTSEIDGTYLYFTFTKPGANYNVNIVWRIFEAPIPLD